MESTSCSCRRVRVRVRGIHVSWDWEESRNEKIQVLAKFGSKLSPSVAWACESGHLNTANAGSIDEYSFQHIQKGRVHTCLSLLSTLQTRTLTDKMQHPILPLLLLLPGHRILQCRQAFLRHPDCIVHLSFIHPLVISPLAHLL